MAGGDLIGRSEQLPIFPGRPRFLVGQRRPAGVLPGKPQSFSSPTTVAWPHHSSVISKHSSITVNAALNLAKVRDPPHKGQEFPIFCLAIRADEKILKTTRFPPPESTAAIWRQVIVHRENKSGLKEMTVTILLNASPSRARVTTNSVEGTISDFCCPAGASEVLG